MGALSGKYGEALVGSCNILEFLAWDLEYGAEPQEYASRAGAGATQTVDGVESGSGTLQLNFDPNAAPQTILAHGSLYTLILRHTATGPVQATGQARIGKHSYGANRDGTIQQVTVPFVTHGAWTLAGDS